MLTMLLDRLTGLLRPAKPAAQTPSERDRAPLISPITIGLLESLGIRRVNGGLTCLDDRLKLYIAALRYLGVST